MEGTVLDPPIPYVGPIRGGRFSPGKIVKIQGITPSTAYRFNINLQCGSETVPRDDVCMQISVRMLEGHISLNSLQNGIWGEEQFCLTLPIKRAEEFEIGVKCNLNQYEVVINGQHFCNFPQRIHYNRITHLAIDGDVSIIRISYTSASRGEGGTLGGAGGSVSQATAPFPNETDDFALINSNTATTPPPSYDAAIQTSQIGFASANTPAAGPPYPTSAPYPTTAPYPTGPSTIPMPSVSPYNVNGTVPAPYPTGASYTASYPSAGGSGMPHVVPIPLNAPSSNFQPIQRNNCNWKKCCAVFWGITFCLILAMVVGIIRSNKKHEYRG